MDLIRACFRGPTRSLLTAYRTDHSVSIGYASQQIVAGPGLIGPLQARAGSMRLQIRVRASVCEPLITSASGRVKSWYSSGGGATRQSCTQGLACHQMLQQ